MLTQEREYVIVVHGGAGAMENLEDDKEKSTLYYAALDSALSIGNAILSAGGEGPEAVMAVVNYFENNPLFNAGKGATCTSAGTFELDASIMEGKDLTAGAVAGLKTVKNPINAAYAVKTKTPHVMLAGEGADRFAKSQGLEIVDNMYFATPKTLKWIEDLKKESKKNGTVGCVVLDKQGNLTAGTSTGGMFKKQWGRVGDSPVIGAGTYADNEGCAVSCTGHGEYFIRHVVAYNLSTRVKLLHQPVGEAADYIIHQELNTKEGNGGLIAVDKKGNFAMPFNRQTCEIIAGSHPVVTTPLLRERDWGDFTGKFIPDLPKDPKDWPDNIETLEKMKSRAQNFLTWLKVTYPDQTVLAVGHGIINKAIQSVYYKRPMNQIEKMANAEVRVLIL